MHYSIRVCINTLSVLETSHGMKRRWKENTPSQCLSALFPPCAAAHEVLFFHRFVPVQLQYCVSIQQAVTLCYCVEQPLLFCHALCEECRKEALTRVWSAMRDSTYSFRISPSFRSSRGILYCSKVISKQVRKERCCCYVESPSIVVVRRRGLVS